MDLCRGGASAEGFGRSNIYICYESGPPDAPVSYFVRFERPDTGRYVFLVGFSSETGWRGTIKGGVLYTIHCTLIADS